MRKLSREKRIQIIKCLVEGCSIRSTERLTGVGKRAITKLMVDMARVCQQWHDENVRGLQAARVQCDEIWAFCGCKEKAKAKGASGEGDVWTWTAIDADTKLAISWLVGERDGGHAFDFMHDLAGRLNSRVQLTTDGLEAYVGAVVDNFGPYVDYAQLVKLYGDDPRLKQKSPSARYSPGRICGCKKYARIGDPEPKHVSTSYVERQNLNMRMGMRRFTRLTNAFSKKVENHEAAIALYFTYYNLCRIHGTLKVTPAMEAGVTREPWEVTDLVGLLEADEQRRIEAGELKRGPYGQRADRA